MEQKIAIVTGASSGIGLATAGKLSQNGYKVYSLSRSGKSEGSVSGMSCNVTSEEQVESAFKAVFEKEGRIDLLVNNAGFGISGAVEFTELSQAKKQFDVNFFGCFVCCKAVCKYMRKNGGGKICVRNRF